MRIRQIINHPILSYVKTTATTRFFIKGQERYQRAATFIGENALSVKNMMILKIYVTQDMVDTFIILHAKANTTT